MHPFAAFAVRTLGAATVTAVLSVGAVSAATAPPSPAATPTSGTAQPSTTDCRSDRRVIFRAIVEAEADVLNMKPDALAEALKDGKKVSDIAKAKALTKAEFTTRLLVNLTLRLDALVDHKVITREEARKVLAGIASGHVPFWDGIHRRK